MARIKTEQYDEIVAELKERGESDGLTIAKALGIHHGNIFSKMQRLEGAGRISYRQVDSNTGGRGYKYLYTAL